MELNEPHTEQRDCLSLLSSASHKISYYYDDLKARGFQDDNEYVIWTIKAIELLEALIDDMDKLNDKYL